MDGIDAILLALVVYALGLAAIAVARTFRPHLRALRYAALAAAVVAIALIVATRARSDSPPPEECGLAVADLAEAREIHAWWVQRYDAGLVEPDDGRTAGGRSWHLRWINAYDRALRVVAASCEEAA